MARGKAKKTPNIPASPPVQGGGSRPAWAIFCVVLGIALCAASLQSMLGSSIAAGGLASRGLMNRIDGWLSGEVPTASGSGEPLLPPYAPIFFLLAAVSLFTWLGGAFWISRRCNLPFSEAAGTWGLYGWLWWLVGGSWEVVRLLVGLIGPESQLFVLSSASFWIAAGVAGWLATFVALAFAPAQRGDSAFASAQREPALQDNYRIPLAVWACSGAYLVVFVAMNWQLYRGLRLPHGDSAMYEEHLWNLLHGKGFRSYLDQGIFLGEHVQVIHLLLIPLYLLWPSQMLLELCDSAALAACCIPVYWMARRHTGQSRAAFWMAAACLLYFPLQYLDIAIDLKTFRPNGLAIPILLFAIDQLERRRYKTFCLLAAVALTAQEDYAIVLAPLGVWIALTAIRRNPHAGVSETEGPALAEGSVPGRTGSIRVNWPLAALGVGLTLFSVVYLVVATRVVMVYFRHGQEIHYASYFSKFGKTLPEIAQTMVTHPTRLWEAFVNAHSAEYALMLLAPLGFLPLFSPGRLAVALPLFLTLCLNEVIDSPLHHVHAAAVPILLWSAAAGLRTTSRRWFGLRESSGRQEVGVVSESAASRALWWARFAGLSALLTGMFYGLSPLSIGFWDPNSGFYWRDLYVVDKRAELFERVRREIPANSRVASTDFVHPRFTHFDRSYDYSDYPRAVNNYQPGVPADTDYIVIDTQHPYSKIKRPDEVPEYRDHPDQWELLPDTTEGFFIVLKHKPSASPAAQRS
ncbi:MAG TPA: DUF2079 domain-containing protein [Planctomycetaceae bacterium]|nr:DUF2079 domain-containing protein [Planctomycetaceae bacterium]